MLVIEGFKWGMRVFTLHCNGKLYVYDEFFVKIAGVKYDESNTKDRRIHLTHIGVSLCETEKLGVSQWLLTAATLPSPSFTLLLTVFCCVLLRTKALAEVLT